MLKKEKRYINFKVGVIGETEVGKTSLVNNYMGLDFEDPDFTTGTAIDLIPPTANEASALLLVYDLNDVYTLRRLENYYNESLRKNSRNFFIVGCKFDTFLKQRKEYIDKMTDLSIKVSNLFEKPLVFCSSRKSVNIKKLFKLIICQHYGIDSKVKEQFLPGEPVLIYRKFLRLKKMIRERQKNKKSEVTKKDTPCTQRDTKKDKKMIKEKDKKKPVEKEKTILKERDDKKVKERDDKKVKERDDKKVKEKTNDKSDLKKKLDHEKNNKGDNKENICHDKDNTQKTNKNFTKSAKDNIKKFLKSKNKKNKNVA